MKVHGKQHGVIVNADKIVNRPDGTYADGQKVEPGKSHDSRTGKKK